MLLESLNIPLSNLRELNLRHNQMSTLQGSPFEKLNSLESLTARGNHLNSLGPDVLKGLFHLIKLFLKLKPAGDFAYWLISRSA